MYKIIDQIPDENNENSYVLWEDVSNRGYGIGIVSYYTYPEEIDFDVAEILTRATLTGIISMWRKILYKCFLSQYDMAIAQEKTNERTQKLLCYHISEWGKNETNLHVR